MFSNLLSETVPALLTRISTGPCSASIAATPARQASPSLTSHLRAGMPESALNAAAQASSAMVVDHHRVAGLLQGTCDGGADAARAAGNERKPFHLSPPLARSRPSVQYMWWPPLTEIVEPVMKSASSAIRKSTARAMSSARPRRPTGMEATIFSSTASGTARTISVST